MSETTSSQPHNSDKANPFKMPFPFDLSAFAGMSDFWQKATGDQQGRVTAVLDQMAKLEEQNAAEARRVVEEMTRLTLASLDYSRELSSNFRKMAVELSKRTAA